MNKVLNYDFYDEMITMILEAAIIKAIH